jgi:hypothetical protein
MLNMLAVTEEDEIAPDQVFPALAAFAELAQRGGDAARVGRVALAKHLSPTKAVLNPPAADPHHIPDPTHHSFCHCK